MNCQHHISDVGLHRLEVGFFVECEGCDTVLGFLDDPREFQMLRRRVLAEENLKYHEADRS